MADQIPFGTNDFAEDPEPRVPCVLVLDVSGSMRGQTIGALNEGLSREQFNVSVGRGRIKQDDKQELFHAIQPSIRRPSATELVETVQSQRTAKEKKDMQATLAHEARRHQPEEVTEKALRKKLGKVREEMPAKLERSLAETMPQGTNAAKGEPTQKQLGQHAEAQTAPGSSPRDKRRCANNLFWQRYNSDITLVITDT